MYYIHFTSKEDAQAIVKHLVLFPCSYLGCVEAGLSPAYAAQVGGVFAPSVQLTKLGRPNERSCAVLFEAVRPPDWVTPEEVVWDVPEATGLELVAAVVVSLEDAIAALDGSAGIADPSD